MDGNWLINHIIPVKTSASNVKEKIMKFFETKADKNIHKDQKPKDISAAFDDSFIKYKSKSDEQLIIEQYLENIRPCLHYMIDGFKTFGKWKIHLAININFVSRTSCIEKHLIHFESDKIEIMTGFGTK